MSNFLASETLFENVAYAWRLHARTSPWWTSVNEILERERHDLRTSLESRRLLLGPLGEVPFTLVDMGAISSVDLFGLDELIIFSFYWMNRERYQSVVDMGANVGLHSLVLARMGFRVAAFEPDPHHLVYLRDHLRRANVLNGVTIHEAAVGPESGRETFVRVLGNTTGSHVSGAKPAPYGDLETFEVEVVSASEAIQGADLVKMDVEGLEANLLESLTSADLQSVDIICEVGSRANAHSIWNRFRRTPMRLFSQKLGWSEAQRVEDLPESYRDGSLLITARDQMPWWPPSDSG